MSTASLLDRDCLDGVASAVGADVFATLLASFITELGETTANIAAAEADGRRDLVETQAHGLKSAAFTFGAIQLGECCLALEDAARSGESGDAVSALISAVHATASATRAAIEGYRPSYKAGY